MKKSMLVSILLASALLVLSSCGGKKAETETAAPASETQTESVMETETETEAAKDDIAAYDEVMQAHSYLDAFAAKIHQNIHNQADTDNSADYDLNGTIAVSGLHTPGALTVAITDGKDADHNNEFYTEGYYYSSSDDLRIKYALSEDLMKSYLASFTFDGLDSRYVTDVSRTEKGAEISYNFVADMSTIQEYIRAVLPDIEDNRLIRVTSMTGTITTNPDGRILNKQIVSTYTATLGKEVNSYTNTLAIDYDLGTNAAVIELPDLSEYLLSDSTEGLPVHEQSKTVYTTTELNMRSKYTTSSVVLTTFPAYTQLTQTGYTDNGWIQVKYNDITGFVFGSYISEKAPYSVTAASGSRWLKQDAYAYLSPSYSSPAAGTAAKGSEIEITGITDNNWTQFIYKDTTCYIASDLLTDKDPSKKEPETGDYETVDGTVVGISQKSMQVRAEGGLIDIQFGKSAPEAYEMPAIGDEITVTFYKDGNTYYFDNMVNHSTSVTYTKTGTMIAIDDKQMNFRAEGANITVYFVYNKIDPAKRPAEGDEITVTFHEEEGRYVFDELTQ